MPENETEALVAYVDDLLKATSEDKIPWAPFNPTTFIWDRQTPPEARLILQRIERTVITGSKVVDGTKVAVTGQRYFHVLTVTTVGKDSFSVTVNGQTEDPRINEKLGAIYDSISVGIVGKKLDFLRKTLPK
ncbi:MAG: hypothetical protein ABSD43_06265 [Terracidiphilus sp.]|jgi:hypothetical protein